MGAGEQIRREVTSWPGVTAEAHQFGGIEYRLGRKELGHVHGDHLADLPFTRKIHDELLAAGRAEIHHVLPESGWVSRRIGGDTSAEVDEVISLFRLNYDRYTAGMAPAAGTV